MSIVKNGCGESGHATLNLTVCFWTDEQMDKLIYLHGGGDSRKPKLFQWFLGGRG